jgi:hypothetical protein
MGNTDRGSDNDRGFHREGKLSALEARLAAEAAGHCLELILK